MTTINFHQAIQIVNLKDHQNYSYRKTAAKVGVPKSTIHDNIDQLRSESGAFSRAIDLNPVERLVRTTLTVSMDGKCSSRDISTVISTIWGTPISHQTILKILDRSADIANGLNKEVDYSKVQASLFDEIFQKKEPLLVFAAAECGVINVESLSDRTGDSWETFLKELKGLGLDPESVTTDGGSGALKAIKKVFESAIRCRDLFHILKKLSKAIRVMEARCYRILAKSYDLEEKDIAGAITAMDEFDEAATLFDFYEKNVKYFMLSSYLDHSDSEQGYVDSEALMLVVTEIHETLFLFKKFSQHKAVHDAWTYLVNGDLEIIAYKKSIENLVEKAFGSQFKELILEYFCPFIEYINQYLRSHDSKAKQEIWGKKITKLRAQLRNYTIVDQNEIDNAINMVWEIGKKICKSNSFVESVNSVIRRHLNTYQSIPSWFAPLFTYFWNNRKFARGKRAKTSPMELLTGKISKKSWIDKIVEKFPFNDFPDFDS